MLERILFHKIEAWTLIAVLLMGSIFTITFGWVVLYKTKGGERGGAAADLLVSIAKIPEPLIQLATAEKNIIQPQIISYDKISGLHHYDTDFNETGALLISSFNPDEGVSTVYLYDLAEQKRLFEWVPPVADINENSAYTDGQNQKKNYRTQHPFLMSNGDLVFTSGEGPLVRIDQCGTLKWKIDRHFHHSIEMASNGNFFVPHVIAPPSETVSADNKAHTVSPIRDDGFAEVSPTGQIINEWSVKDILERHGYHGLLYGVGPYEVDRTHLNDVEPILTSDEYVQEGDVALSLRHLSTVFLYRPSTDEIIWLKTGPWTNQHDVDYQGNGIFTIFGNDSLRGNTDQESLRGYSTIWQYDQKDGTTQPFQALREQKIFTATQGLHTLLPNGDIFVEEQNSHILHRVSGSKLRWSYVNTLSDKTIGALHWSRYIPSHQAHFDRISQANCQ